MSITRQNERSIELHARAAHFNLNPDSEIELFAISPDRRTVFHSMTVERLEENSAIVMNPFARMSKAAAQQLVDDLWLLGVRPRASSGSVGQLEATNAHLQDLRRIVSYHTGKCLEREIPC